MPTRTKIITTVAIIMIGIAIIIGSVLIPSFRGIITLAEEISRQQSKAAQALAHARQLAPTTSLIEEIQRELPGLERMIIESGKEIDFFALLEEKNKQNNLQQLVRLSPSVEVLPSLEELPLEFQIQGTFQDILAYISELERMPELIVLRSITLSHSTVSKDSKKPLSATVTGVIYVHKK